MFGIGGFELFLIVLFGFLIFGPDKLPEIAKTIGRAIAKFRDAQSEVSSSLKDIAFDKDSDAPFKNPFDAADKVADAAKRTSSVAKETVAEAKVAAGEKTVKPEGAGVAGAAADAAESAEPARESFSERKARYERERRARAQAAESAPAESPETSDGGGA